MISRYLSVLIVVGERRSIRSVWDHWKILSRGRFFNVARREPVSTGFRTVDWRIERMKSGVSIPSRGIRRGVILHWVCLGFCFGKFSEFGM